MPLPVSMTQSFLFEYSYVQALMRDCILSLLLQTSERSRCVLDGMLPISGFLSALVQIILLQCSNLAIHKLLKNQRLFYLVVIYFFILYSTCTFAL